MVFAGYGVVAPEYGWDDYKGLDVKGKAVVVLAGDPPVADPHDPSKLDPKMFLGPELSFYGRPGSKADLAHRRGAAAVITITGGPAEPLPVRPPGAGAGPRPLHHARNHDRAGRVVDGSYCRHGLAEQRRSREVIRRFGAGSERSHGTPQFRATSNR